MTHGQLLKALAKGGFELVGSQATGMATKHSDWDFAGHNGPAAQELLIRLGFRTVKIPDHILDDITISVWQLRLLYRGKPRRYQAALVRSLIIKERAMSAIMESPELAMLDRNLRGPRSRVARKTLWNALFRCAGWTNDLKYDTVPPKEKP